MVKVFFMVKVFRHHYPNPLIFGFNIEYTRNPTKIEDAAAGP
jgi:hypothetical protein